MSYEIPQALQYKEKIVFNLTLEQLLYAAGFGLTAFLIFFKLPFSIYVSGSLAAIPACLGLMFMFMDLWKKIKTFCAWFKFRKATMYDARMKRYLKLNAIHKNCYLVQTKQGEKRVAVLRIEPINFKLKPEVEQNSIIYGFQKFLNAIDFPIQILMYTDDLNLNKYLKELENKVQKTKNRTYQELSKAHKNYLDTVAKERLGANRRFLIAIQENEIGLDAQLNIILDRLKSIGLKAVRLTGLQLIKILIKFFNNPKRESKTLYNIISPDKILNEPDYIKVNNHHNRIIAAVGYPRTVEEGFLDKIITASGNFDMSIHIEPFPIESTLVMLNKELQKQRADLFAAELKHSLQPSLDIQFADTRAVLDSIQKGQEKLFNVSLYINVKTQENKDEKTKKDKGLEELSVLTKIVQSQLSSILIIPQVPKFRMAQGLRSILPFGTNELGIRRNITTHALSAFFPFTSPFLILEEGGVFLGLNKNKLPIIKDIFNLANANGTILATSGSGKSYAAKLIISRYLMNGTKVIVIDPQNEYTKLTEKYGGKIINISKDSKTIINPLDILNHTYAEKRLALIDFFQTIFGEINPLQRAILDNAASKAYAEVGITDKNYLKKIPPTLRNLHEQLCILEEETTGFEKAAYTTLIARLSMYVDGVFSFLNNQTKIDLENQFVTFNLGEMPKQVKPAMMFLILDYVYTKMKHDKERKLLVIDEAWSLLSRAEEEGYIFEIVKTCRKFNMGLLLITQDVADLVNSKAGRAVLANSSYALLLRQKPAIIDSVQNVFHLSTSEKEHLLTASVGEGLLMMENDHQEIKILASPEEHKLITTKPDELLNIEQQETKEELPLDAKKLIKALQPFKDVYKVSELHEVQKEYLEKIRDPKYTEEQLKNPDEKRGGLYFVRQYDNEGQEHVALAWWIYERLFRYTNTARRIYSKTQEVNPDITFTNAAGQEIAIEVETGSNYRYHLDYLKSKIQRLHDTYPSRWCVFLTDNHYLARYQNLCKDVSIYLRKQLRQFLKEHFPLGTPSQPLSPLNATEPQRNENIDEKNKNYVVGQKKYVVENKPQKHANSDKKLQNESGAQ